ncbi:DUF484 family protein [Immundisolibacter sp.]
MKKSTAKPAADADQVAAYLLLNPDFLESHPQVFEALNVPHPTGGAVSLVERQVAALRERNRALTARLDAVIEAAHRHDGQYRKLLDLAAALAACRDVPALLHALATHLKRDFGTDALRVLARPAPASAAPGATPLLVSAFDPAPFAADIDSSKARCLPEADLPAFLFNDHGLAGDDRVDHAPLYRNDFGYFLRIWLHCGFLHCRAHRPARYVPY